MKTIETGGLQYLKPLEGSGGWYYGYEYSAGDLYEAEEAFRAGHAIANNRLIFVHSPDGQVLEPLHTRKNQYFGMPVWAEGGIVLMLADFDAGMLRLERFQPETERLSPIAQIPLSEIEDCWNLQLSQSPLMLTRLSGNSSTFHILWPERREYAIGENEAFCVREGSRLIFSAWKEDPDYEEEIIVRDAETGAVLERYPGGVQQLQDGQWAALI